PAVGALAGALKTADRSARSTVAEMLAEIGGPEAFDVLADALKSNPDRNGSGDDRIVDALLAIGGERLAEALLPALESRNGRARSAAAKLLAERGEKRAVPALISAFRADPTSKDVIEALAVLKDPRAAGPLLEAFKDRSARDRDILARAIGDVGDGRAAEPVLAELKERWPKRDEKGQHRMIEALCEAAGKVGAAGAVDVLIEATAYGRDSYGGQFIRVAAARSLGRLGENRAIPALADCSTDAENRPASAACEALGLLKDPRSVPPLVKALTSRYREVRSAAAEALVRLGPVAMGPLLERVGEKDRSHRAAIVTVLARMGTAALGGLLEKLKSPDAAARQGAAWALGTLKDNQAFAPLTEALRDEDFEVRGAAVWALRELDDRRAVEPMIRALKDENRRVRSEAISTLGSLGDARAVGPLLACLKDDDGEVRGSAASALGTLGDARGVGPLNELVRTETERLEGLLANLKTQGKLTGDGRMVRDKPMTAEEKRAILTHRSTRSAARMALEKLGRQPAPGEHAP
ncbi:MAG: HEAT repeat domain-containing protein, partial [Phycisphaerae bacterium]